MKQKDLYYAIGLIEGEGTFIARPFENGTGCRFRIVVQMTDKEPLIRLRETMGGKINGPYTNRGDGKKAYRPVWFWAFNRKEGALNFLSRTRPEFSTRRQEQIDRVLELARRYPPRGANYL